MTTPTLLLSPLKAAVSAQGGTLDVLVRLQAPDQPMQALAQQTAKRLALVVDRSGSMSGQPLNEALRCVMHIASHLTPQDQLSVVVYDNRVDVLHPLHYRRPRQRCDRSLWVEGAQWDNLAGSNSGAFSTEVLKTLGARRCLNI